jgi:phosphatidylglycerol---prolipoprotein diacylglyceryl transferase
MTYIVDNLSPFALEFAPGIGLRWYGLAYVAGFLIGWWMLIRLAAQQYLALDAKARGNFILGIILGVLFGGRLGYMLLYGLPEFLHHPLSVLAIWEGGMSSHGGFLGVGIVCWIFSRRTHTSFWTLTDALSIAVPAGLLLGRLANFINGELWGKIAHVPWAVIFPRSAPGGTPLELIAPRHPSQLYEAALEGLFLLVYTQLRYRSTMKAHPGQLTAEFVVLYGLVRIFCELFREPDAGLIMGLSRGTFYSVLMIVMGAGLWLWARKRQA